MKSFVSATMIGLTLLLSGTAIVQASSPQIANAAEGVEVNESPQGLRLLILLILCRIFEQVECPPVPE